MMGPKMGAAVRVAARRVLVCAELPVAPVAGAAPRRLVARSLLPAGSSAASRPTGAALMPQPPLQVPLAVTGSAGRYRFCWPSGFIAVGPSTIRSSLGGFHPSYVILITW